MIGGGTVEGELRPPRGTPAAKHWPPFGAGRPRRTSSSPLPGTVETDHPDVAALLVLGPTRARRPPTGKVKAARAVPSLAATFHLCLREVWEVRPPCTTFRSVM